MKNMELILQFRNLLLYNMFLSQMDPNVDLYFRLIQSILRISLDSCLGLESILVIYMKSLTEKKKSKLLCLSCSHVTLILRGEKRMLCSLCDCLVRFMHYVIMHGSRFFGRAPTPSDHS